MSDLKLAKEKLNEEGVTFAAAKDGKVISSEKRGVVPLIEMLDSGLDYSGFSCADRVCGKAPALIYVLLGVKEVYACVMTHDAMQILEEAGISAAYGTAADKIINRAGTDICPMEKTVLEIIDPKEAVKAIRIKLSEMGILSKPGI